MYNVKRHFKSKLSIELVLCIDPLINSLYFTVIFVAMHGMIVSYIFDRISTLQARGARRIERGRPKRMGADHYIFVLCIAVLFFRMIFVCRDFELTCTCIYTYIHMCIYLLYMFVMISFTKMCVWSLHY